MPESNALSRRVELLICLAFIAATFAVYWQVQTHDFLNYDDTLYVTKNRHVQAGLTWKGLAWAFATGHASNWHPITWVSHMLDCQIFGVSAGKHHFTNVSFHLANTLLLYWVLKWMTGTLWRSAVVAALFCLHPLHVESVAWVAERKDVLSTFFWILTMGAYVSYVKKPHVTRYVLVVLCFAWGLMAKPMVVTLPFVLLLLDYWPLGRLGTEASPNRQTFKKRMKPLWEKAPLFFLSLASCVITFLVQRHGPAVQSLEQVPLANRFANALVSYVQYLKKMIWPRGLAVYYPHPGDALPPWQIVGAFFLLGCISLIVCLKARRHPYLIVGWLWFLGTLVPVIGFVQVGGQAMADRYTYVPLIGLFLAGVWGMNSLAAKWTTRKSVLLSIAFSVLSVLGYSSWRQVARWKNNITLFQHALQVTTDNQLAHNQVGFALSKEGKVEEGIEHFLEALRITPQYVNAHINLGNAYKDQGKLEQAAEHYRKVLQFVPNHVTAKNNLGILLAMEGKMEASMALFSDVLKIDPENVRAHNNLGIALAKQGKFDEAINHFSEALRVDPTSAFARKNLDQALRNRDR
jgi:tetratricopeptide (TPR) repeat protein